MSLIICIVLFILIIMYVMCCVYQCIDMSLIICIVLFILIIMYVMCCVYQCGVTPLMISVQSGKKEMFELLIDSGALPSIISPDKVNI
jgi:predicted neutral ceramidase superfamily lipid hydrolase